MTVFLTSHDAGDIEHLCKRVVILHQGEIVLDDTVNALRRDFMKSRVIDLKLGTPLDDNEPAIPGVQVVKAKGYGLKLEVDTAITPIEAVVTEILRSYQVADITIEHPPMEQIIAEIYRERSRQA